MMRGDPRIFATRGKGPVPGIPKLLFAFLGAPVLWAVHLSLSYFLVTLHCVSAWNGGVWAVSGATLAFAAGSATAGWTAWTTLRRLGRSDPDPDALPDPLEWTRFLLLAGVAASALFTLVIIVQGVVPLFLSTCV
jgi:hypothetical protein